MGSPLSPLLADIFMNKIEGRIFNDKDKSKQVLYWHRYVDDILCVWTGTRRQLDQFLNYLNSLCSSISFTMEIGENKSLNFLDLNVDISTGVHKFGIYRKPTFTDCIIPATSRHPLTHKLAAFHAMVHRLVSVPMDIDAFTKELSTIKQIAKNNGYPVSLVENLLKRKEQQLVNKLLYSIHNKDTQQKKWKRIAYIGKSSVKVSKILKKNEINPAFYCPQTLGKLLRSDGTRTDKSKENGVYKIWCDDCPSFYVGQTGRPFSTRLKEHLSRHNSSFYQHLFSENHKHNSENWKMLHIVNKGKKMDGLETLEIIRESSNPNHTLLNDFPISNSPLLQPIVTNISY